MRLYQTAKRVSAQYSGASKSEATCNLRLPTTRGRAVARNPTYTLQLDCPKFLSRYRAAIKRIAHCPLRMAFSIASRTGFTS